MRVIFSLLITSMFALTICDSSQAQVLDADQLAVRDAFQRASKEKRLDSKSFKTIHGWMTRWSGKEKWRLIEWRTDLWQARKESAKLDKPIFIWAMNGDPLGCV